MSTLTAPRTVPQSPGIDPGLDAPCEDVEALLGELAQLRRENRELSRRRKFGLVWEDQPEERIETEMRTRLPLLRHLPSLDVPGAAPAADRPHVLIEGDNLHALTVLQATHKAAVDVIYADPPYNTGSKDFRYNDRFVEKEDSYRHSAWLSFMDRRLRLARPLLADTGVILIAIDDNEQAHLRLLCDQIFGERNLLGVIVWDGGPKNGDRFLSESTDYMLAYARSKSALTAAGTRWRERPEATDLILAKAGVIRLKYPDNATRTRELRRWLASLPKGHAALEMKHYSNIDDRGVWFGDAVHSPAGSGPRYSLPHPITGRACKTPSRGWLYGEERMHLLIAEGLIEFGPDETTLPKRKRYLDEHAGKLPHAVFRKDRRGAAQQLSKMIGPNQFSFPKNPDVLARWLSIVAGKDATVLDFFAGSGSTAHAVAMLNAADGGNRQCILVTNNEGNIARGVTQPRLKAALTGRWADADHDPLPGSLQFFTTDLLRKARSRDAMRMKVATALTDLLAVRENCFTVSQRGERHVVLTNGSRTVVLWTALFDDTGLPDLLATIEAAGTQDRVLYACSAGLFGPDQALVDLTARYPNWRVEALPGPYLDELEKAQTTAARRPR